MKFLYKGFDNEGRPVDGQTTAESPKQATAFLQEQGISVTEMHAAGGSSSVFSRGNIDANDIATFCEQLANLTDSDMPLPEALEAVSQEASNKRLKRELDQLSTGVSQGRDLANMLEEKQNRFPPILTALIRAGQKTGKLSETLRMAGTHLWQMSVLRDRVQSIIAYPVMVFILTCVIGSLVFMRVVPHFQEMFHNLDVSLPRHTQAVLFIGDYYPFFAIGALGFVLFLIVMFRYVHTPPEWVRLRRRILFKLPLLGNILAPFHVYG